MDTEMYEGRDITTDYCGRIQKWMKGGTHRQMLFWIYTTDVSMTGRRMREKGLSEMDYLQISRVTSGTHSWKWKCTKWFMNKE
jgi:hypothetical protein